MCFKSICGTCQKPTWSGTCDVESPSFLQYALVLTSHASVRFVYMIYYLSLIHI